VSLKIVFLPLLAFEVIILVDNARYLDRILVYLTPITSYNHLFFVL